MDTPSALCHQPLAISHDPRCSRAAIFFPRLSCCLRSPGRLPASASSASCRWATPAARPLLRSAACSATVSTPGSSPISRRSASTLDHSNPQSAIRNPQCSPRPTGSSSAPPRPRTFRRPTRGRCASADTWRRPPSLRLRDLDAHVGPSQRVPHRVLGQRRPDQLRADEHRRLGGHSASRRVLDRVRPAAGASRVLVSGVDDDTSDVADVGAGRELDLHARRAGSARCSPSA